MQGQGRKGLLPSTKTSGLYLKLFQQHGVLRHQAQEDMILCAEGKPEGVLLSGGHLLSFLL